MKDKHFRSPWFACAAVILVGLSAATAAEPCPRERLLLDFGWKFHLGNSWGIGQDLAKAGTGRGPADTTFSDADWRTLNLPHDWAVELPFDEKANGSHGFKPVGPDFPTNSVGWYRRTFVLPKEDAGKRLWVEFDGAFRDSVVFLNGWCLGRQESGYSSFRYDITDVANCGGKNTLAVKVDASQTEGWFYEGAGIYRHVWLVKTGPIAVAPDGTFVFSEFRDNVPTGAATLHIQTTLLNTPTAPTGAVVKCEILAPDGNAVARARKSVHLGAQSQQEIRLTARVSAPVLWSPETPDLYRLRTTVESKGKVLDCTETTFGIRTVAFDANKGFLLNGKPYVLKGTCNHQDHAGVGAALPDRLQFFRVARLKEMGCNADRTSHNPPTPEFLDACDQLGMIVMDENRLLGSAPQNLARMAGLVRRDRNHPSVCIWSIANEEFKVQTTAAGGRVAETMQALVKRLDPTRPVTYAANVGNEFKGINSVIEVRGWNYYIGATNMDAYHAAHPRQPEVGTEQGSTVSTRGIYANDKVRGYVGSYDDNAPAWAHTAETWWSFFAPRPWLSGAFVWTGFDYRGEPTPYWWPCINSHFGIMDTCGFAKDNFYYYQSWWTDRPVLHLLPHWNWPGREGQEIDVRALSNCEEVELFLNGQSLGRQAMPKNSHLRWNVKYAPGTLSAKGYRAGQLIAETKVETTGAPAAVQLLPDRSTINADGEDVSIITVAVTDAQGRVVPVANNHVRFSIDGPGRLLGVGNGDPSCHEPDVFIAAPAVQSSPIAGWRWKKVSSARRTRMPEVAERCDDSNWAAADVASGEGPLGENEDAVFRARLPVTEALLTNAAITLHFGRIDEDGWVYVNGRRVGESHEWQDTPSFEIKSRLHPGDNTIAVAVANKYGPGGINLGVALETRQEPPPSQWSRSVFNGLAQLLVQSSKEPGAIKVRATADGLAPATASLEARPCTPRPQVP
ncbi:MAG TPA: beta-galactosidase GalA [Candidatus Acidoferrum sp.]|nr:beta-galactosidase GalA [Candidatus Acidoferrum sp.]